MDKTFDAAARERDIYAAWEAAGAFRAGAGKRRDETFCIMIPPPNVTGALHMGHAFNNTLQDILTRWHRMRGHDTLWQPGTDHAGIATQMVVERELAKEGNVGRREMGREKFIERVWQQKQKSRGNIRAQLERLGASCDWSREAFTMGGAPGDPDRMGPNFHDAVLRVFVDLYDKGLIYRGKRLVNWDPHFETAISDLEVEQVEVDGHLWRLRYPLENGETFDYVETDEDGNETLRETRDYITVATTRPETMLGDTGVAVHPDDPRYAHLVGKTVRLPLVGRSIPIVADPYADPAKGTGAVKITPAHDFNDWEVGQRTALHAVNVMTPRAAMHLKGNADFLRGADPDDVARTVEALDGADRYEARDWIVDVARDEGWLDGIDADSHAVPHGDRSKAAIEPYLTDQWFVDSEKIVAPAIDAVRDGRTTILPESDAKVYFHWLENIEPWCISRQLWWGHQIPVWYGPCVRADGEFLHAASEAPDEPDVYLHDGHWRKAFCAASPDAAREEAEAWYRARLHHRVVVLFEGEDEDAAGEFAEEPGTTFIRLVRDPDVLDTWFSSGLWPLGTLGWPEDTEELRRYFPTSVLVTGFDIIFFWVARMMMMQLELVREVPFRTVYVHALVRDEKGKKMSKSLGNVLDPIDLIDEFGADAVRFTLTAMAAMGRDLKLSRERIAGYRNFVTKLWNAHRFAEMNGVLATPAPAAPPEATATVNRWIIGETARVREEVDAALAAFRFNDAAGALYAFVWGVVCDWYVEFSKPLFDAEKAEETREVMAWVLDQCLVLLHPIMPFVTEELWSLGRRRPTLLALAEWPSYGSELVDAASESEMRWVISLIENVRSVKGEMNVPAKAEVSLLLVDLDDAGRDALARNEDLILRLARLKAVVPADTVPRGSATIAVEGGTFALPLADIIDLEAEKSRLSKALEKLGKEAAGLNGRLSNARFVESAPPEVVEETRELLAQKQEEQARLHGALSRLTEAADA